MERLSLLAASSMYASVLQVYKEGGGQPQRPVNFMTRPHWESNSKLGNHHRGKVRSAYQATALDNLGGITTEARHGAHVKLPL